MKLFAFIPIVVVLACSKPDHELRQARESAAYIEKELAPAVVNDRIAYFAKSPNDDVKALAFPVLRARGSCGVQTLEVMYNPYRDLMQISFGKTDAMVHHLETLSLQGKVVWRNPKKLERHKYLVDTTTAPRDPLVERQRVTLDRLMQTHPQLFLPGQDVVVSVTGVATVSRNVGADRFDYVSHQHPTWQIRLHVFSAEMAKRIDAHTKALAAPHATLYVIARFRDSIARIRSVDDPAVKRAVKRFDELAVPAQTEVDKLGAMPFSEHATSLAVEALGACP